MATLVMVTDYLSGEQVIINADTIQSIRRQDDKTVISFDRDLVCCNDSPYVIYAAVQAAQRGTYA